MVTHLFSRRFRASKIFRLLILLIGGVGSLNCALADEGELCDQKWWEITGRQDSGRSRDFSLLLKEWNRLEKQCRGTGIYEIRLASILLMLDRYHDATEFLDNADIPHKYQAQAEAVKLNARLYRALSKDKPDLTEFLQVRNQSLISVDKYPNETALYSLLGHVQVLLGEYAAAIGPLEKAIDSKNEADLSGPYRNLVIAYSRSNHYQSAIGVIDEAYRLDRSVTSDKEFMFAAANAYAATGKPDTAKKFLTLILNKYPELKDDPVFAQAVMEAKQLSGGRLK